MKKLITFSIVMSTAFFMTACGSDDKAGDLKTVNTAIDAVDAVEATTDKAVEVTKDAGKSVVDGAVKDTAEADKEMVDGAVDAVTK